MKKIITSAAAVIILVAAGFGIYSLFAKPQTIVNPVGNAPSLTNAGSKVQVTLSTSSSTMASFYNNDGNDRVITEINLFTPGENTTQTITVATSSVASYNTGTAITTFAFATTSTPANYNYQLSSVSGTTGTATSTANSTNLIWPSGTYLNFIGNGIADASTTQAAKSGTATSTVKYGFAAVEYISQ